MKLFFDTETTGKADMRSPATAKHQPYIVQLGAILCEDGGRERASVSLIIKPDGWKIPQEAADIHGITDAIAEACGVPIISALSVLSMLALRADTVIAHNLDFDLFVAAAAFHRIGKESRLAKMQRFCTMKATTELCRLPGRYGFKWPKLEEALDILLQEKLEGAHDAMADTRGCARLYFHLQSLPPPPPKM